MTPIEKIANSRAVTLRRAAWARSIKSKLYFIAHHENRVRDALAKFPPEIAGEIVDAETRDIGTKLGVVL